MKLKTLKDFWRYSHEPKKSYEKRRNTGNIVKVIKLQTLKKEIIKWVKECREKFGHSATCDFWMEKLNITEEDLK